MRIIHLVQVALAVGLSGLTNAWCQIPELVYFGRVHTISGDDVIAVPDAESRSVNQDTLRRDAIEFRMPAGEARDVFRAQSVWSRKLNQNEALAQLTNFPIAIEIPRIDLSVNAYILSRISIATPAGGAGALKGDTWLGWNGTMHQGDAYASYAMVVVMNARKEVLYSTPIRRANEYWKLDSHTTTIEGNPPHAVVHLHGHPVSEPINWNEAVPASALEEAAHLAVVYGPAPDSVDLLARAASRARLLPMTGGKFKLPKQSGRSSSR